MWCPKSCGGTCPIPAEGANIPLVLCPTTHCSFGHNSADSVSRCTKCKAIAKATDAVLDALRIGQEALDKATALQFKGKLLSTPYSCTRDVDRSMLV